MIIRNPSSTLGGLGRNSYYKFNSFIDNVIKTNINEFQKIIKVTF